MSSYNGVFQNPYKSKGVYIFARYFTAFMLMLYGFAKINESQFTVVEWVQDEPLKDVHGFWLVWYYMSYSKTYATIVALIQILAGGMLLFRRTTLLGAAILLPVMANIVLINIFFQIPQSAFIAAFLITVSLIVILIHHHQELLDLFWQRQNALFPDESYQTSTVITKWTVRILVLILPAIFTYWIANYNNISPTPIDGVWDVTEVTGEMDTEKWPSRIYFERERAFMAVLRYDNHISQKHFEVNKSESSVELWDQWLQKGDKYMSANYQFLDDSKLILEGNLANGNVPVRIVLEKVR